MKFVWRVIRYRYEFLRIAQGCRRHRSYRGVRKPRTSCARCKQLKEDVERVGLWDLWPDLPLAVSEAPDSSTVLQLPPGVSNMLPNMLRAAVLEIGPESRSARAREAARRGRRPAEASRRGLRTPVRAHRGRGGCRLRSVVQGAPRTRGRAARTATRHEAPLGRDPGRAGQFCFPREAVASRARCVPLRVGR